MRRKRYKYSNRQFFYFFVVMFILLFAITTWASLVSVRTGTHLVDEYVDETSALYVDNINKELYRINQDLIYTMDTFEVLQKIPDSFTARDTAYYEMQWKIEQHNREQKSCYDSLERVFVYGVNADVLITDSGCVFSSETTNALNAAIMKYLSSNNSWSNKSTHWDVIWTDNGYPYMIGYYPAGDVVLGCALNPVRFLSALEVAADTYEIIPYILTDNNLIIKAGKYEDSFIEDISTGVISSKRTIKCPLRFTGTIYINVLKGKGIHNTLESLQFTLVILTIIAFGLIMLTLYLYIRRILLPMERFVSGLEDLSNEKNLHDDATQNLVELESANQRFRELVKRIQTLRIEVYEKELNEQRIELEFAQEQIRPHFFLNCLSLIHGIADERGESDIKNIAETMSEYIRYIFQRSKSMRTVREEMTHVEAYVKIQQIRYGEGAFSFETMMEPDVEELTIPYLLLQPLVENAIVHEVSLDKLIEISIYITRENLEGQEFLYISVSDTGSGFRQEVLDKFEKDEPVHYNGRDHIGLLNIKKRIQLIYGGRGQMNLSNMDEGFGGVVEIRIPIQEGNEKAAQVESSPYLK